MKRLICSAAVASALLAATAHPVRSGTVDLVDIVVLYPGSFRSILTTFHDFTGSRNC